MHCVDKLSGNLAQLEAQCKNVDPINKGTTFIPQMSHSKRQ